MKPLMLKLLMSIILVSGNQARAGYECKNTNGDFEVFLIHENGNQGFGVQTGVATINDAGDFHFYEGKVFPYITRVGLNGHFYDLKSEAGEELNFTVKEVFETPPKFPKPGPECGRALCENPFPPNKNPWPIKAVPTHYLNFEFQGQSHALNCFAKNY